MPLSLPAHRAKTILRTQAIRTLCSGIPIGGGGGGQSAGGGTGVCMDCRWHANHHARVHSPGTKAGRPADVQGAVTRRGQDLELTHPHSFLGAGAVPESMTSVLQASPGCPPGIQALPKRKCANHSSVPAPRLAQHSGAQQMQQPWLRPSRGSQSKGADGQSLRESSV